MRPYVAFVRISEALAACRQPEELAKTLSDLLGEFLSFEHLDVLALKENSTEIEWHVWGKGGPPLARICHPRTCRDGTLITRMNPFTFPTGTLTNDSQS